MNRAIFFFYLNQKFVFKAYLFALTKIPKIQNLAFNFGIHYKLQTKNIPNEFSTLFQYNKAENSDLFRF